MNPLVADVLALDLRFPVSAIAKRTGDDKSNVSVWIRGRKPASPAFLVRFYTAFQKDLAEKGIKRDVNKLVSKMTTTTELITEKDFLRSINSKLTYQNDLLLEMNERSKRLEQKADELLRRKDKEIMRSAKEYLLGIVATLRSATE